jgi:integrase
MRIPVKGIHWTLAKLADGTTKTYWYAWKNGPRLHGEYGSPEFIANYNAAIAQRVPVPEGRLQSLIDGYQKSQKFLSRSARTRDDYIKQIAIIEKEFGDFPLKALAARETRGEFLDWRDRLITVNPCEKGGRLYHGTRAEFVWTIEDEAAFLQHGPAHLHLPLLLALWTGQRQGDLLRLTWSAYDGTHIKLRQSKTGVRVQIPVGTPLKTALDAAAKTKRSPTILLNSEGRPWTPDGFRASWGKACDKARIVDVTFNDLRGTAVTRLALVECTEAEIATITGHSLRDVRSILDAHYLNRDHALAESAIRKLEMGYAIKTGTNFSK